MLKVTLKRTVLGGDLFFCSDVTCIVIGRVRRGRTVLTAEGPCFLQKNIYRNEIPTFINWLFRRWGGISVEGI
jgi:hypothetical protein